MKNSDLKKILEDSLPNEVHNSIKCKYRYYNEMSFNDQVKKFNPHVALFHQNIISLNKHIDELVLFLSNLDIYFDLIGLTEIGISSNIDAHMLQFIT